MIHPTRIFVAAALFATATISPVKAETSFLEAALFFLTAADTRSEDSVTDREIILRRYPIVAYLVDGEPCKVRLRNTSDHRIFQIDFCKLTSYSFWRQPEDVYGGMWVFGRGFQGWNSGPEPEAFCVSTWLPDKNYLEPDFRKTGNPVRCQSQYLGNMHIKDFVEGSGVGYHRPQERMVASFKYIVMSLTPPEQRKPY